MSNPRELPHLASPAGVLGRLTVVVSAWLAAGLVLASTLPAILTPIPVARLVPPPTPVVARTPLAPAAVPGVQP